MAMTDKNGASQAASNSKAPLAQADTVIAAERIHLGKEETEDLSGLALSGGGIRSASFGMGVMQALVAAGIFKKLDYLSTASGGGYVGTALTWFMHKDQGTSDKPLLDGYFPFGVTRAGLNAENRGPWRSNSRLDFLRQHSQYLTPGNWLDTLSLVGVALRTICVSFFVHFGFLLLLVLFVQIFAFGVQGSGWLDPIESMKSMPYMVRHNPIAALAVYVAELFAGLSVVFAVTSGMSGPVKRIAYAVRRQSQVLLGLLVKLFAVLLIYATLEPVSDYLQHPIDVAGLGAMVGALIGFWQRRKVEPKGGGGNKWLSMLAIVLVGYGLLLGAYTVVQAYSGHLGLYLGIVALLILAHLVNTNQFSLHRMYRDRLMEAFMPSMESVDSNNWGPAKEADGAMLHDMCSRDGKVLRPYHLLNSNVVLIDSPMACYEGRGGDSFMLSPLYCGSDASGYIQTKDWSLNGANGLSLASAMSISGAAFNPTAGNNGRGATHSVLLSGLLTVLNLRLGQWVSNPARQTSWFSKRANFITTGLPALLLKPHSEKKPMLELTDGGHFDNLAVYELIRRKLDLIIVSDAGADPECCFDDFGNMVEKVRVDFGVKIRFSDPVYNMDSFQPGTSEVNAIATKKWNLSKHAFAIASIEYPDSGTAPGKHGTLIYIKAGLLDGLPTDLYTYKSMSPLFPHESTVDQFFDEVQFEAYRELAYQLTWTMLNAMGTSPTATTWCADKDKALGLFA